MKCSDKVVQMHNNLNLFIDLLDGPVSPELQSHYTL